mmetsp:Transcript_19296/g.30269  ORF Transcript_19296/g.30269 Transcript_19296/m.30269 type:complete len:230 (+) Transcript_19296:133-822(+)
MLFLSYMMLLVLAIGCFLLTSVIASVDTCAFVHTVSSGPKTATTTARHTQPNFKFSSSRSRSRPLGGSGNLGPLGMSLVDRTSAASLPEIEKISGWEAYQKIVAGSTQKLVVVKFMGQHCRSCKAIEKKFQRLAGSFPNVNFYEVDAVEEEEIAFNVNIQALPSFVFYSQGKELEQTTCGPNTFNKIIEKVTQYSVAGVASLFANDVAGNDEQQYYEDDDDSYDMLLSY